jgi:hypothetical protein
VMILLGVRWVDGGGEGRELPLLLVTVLGRWPGK